MLLENPEPQKIVPQYPYDSYKTGYITFSKKTGRRSLNLYNSNEDKGVVPYARYMYAVHIGERVPDWLEVDHVNNDRSDDRIENLQLLTRQENMLKYVQHYRDNIQVRHDFNCPHCDKVFQLTDSRYRSRLKEGLSKFFCSRTCYDEYVRANKKTVTVPCSHCSSDVIFSECQYRLRQEKGFKKVFCDGHCQREYNRVNHLKTLDCDECGLPFTIHKGVYTTRVKNNVTGKLCCSQECADTARVRPELNHEFTCENCDKKYTIYDSVLKALESKGQTSRFCSRDCADDHKRKGDWVKHLNCHNCSKPFTISTGYYNSRYNSGTRDFYCSRECFFEKRKTNDLLTVTCAFCFRDTEIKEAQYRNKTKKGQKNFFCMGSDCYKKFRLFGGDKRDVRCANCDKELEHRSEIKHAIVTSDDVYLHLCSTKCLEEKVKEYASSRTLNKG